MSEVELTDKHFPYKLLLDFANLVTTVVDLLLLKGPAGLKAAAQGPEALGQELLAQLSILEEEAKDEESEPEQSHEQLPFREVQTKSRSQDLRIRSFLLEAGIIDDSQEDEGLLLKLSPRAPSSPADDVH